MRGHLQLSQQFACFSTLPNEVDNIRIVIPFAMTAAVKVIPRQDEPSTLYIATTAGFRVSIVTTH